MRKVICAKSLMEVIHRAYEKIQILTLRIAGEEDKKALLKGCAEIQNGIGAWVKKPRVAKGWDIGSRFNIPKRLRNGCGSF